LVVLRLGVRLFNDAGAALKCARAGYWQPAFAILRDLMETTWLLDYFRIEPARIERWRTSDYRVRQKEFKGPVVREAVNRGQPSTRHQVYSDYSEGAAHPSPEGFALISPNDVTNIGPFPDEVRLRVFLREMASIFLDGALTFNAILPGRDGEMLRATVSLIRAAEVWTSKYMVHTHRAMVEALEELEPLIPPDGPLRDAFEGRNGA
jgi:hypothetical protein